VSRRLPSASGSWAASLAPPFALTSERRSPGSPEGSLVFGAARARAIHETIDATKTRRAGPKSMPRSCRRGFRRGTPVADAPEPAHPLRAPRSGVVLAAGGSADEDANFRKKRDAALASPPWVSAAWEWATEWSPRHRHEVRLPGIRRHL